MTRFKAASLHLVLSIVIITVLISLMLTVWYPNAYFKLMGGKALIYLIGGVDIFLGPLLTFVVFKSGKKSLKFDLSCIAILQATAMSYGVYVMFEARPVFIAFNKTAFQVVSVLDISENELALGKKEEWRTLSITGPKLVAIGAPNKRNKKEVVFADTVSGGAAAYPKLYDDYKNHQTEAIRVAKPLLELVKANPNNQESIDSFIGHQKRPATDFLFLPVTSMVNEMVAIIDEKTGEFVKIVDAKPSAALVK